MGSDQLFFHIVTDSMREGLNLESLKVKLRPSKQRIWPACMLSAASCKVLVDPRLLSKNHLTPPPRGAQGGCNPNPLPEIKMGIKSICPTNVAALLITPHSNLLLAKHSLL